MSHSVLNQLPIAQKGRVAHPLMAEKMFGTTPNERIHQVVIGSSEAAELESETEVEIQLIIDPKLVVDSEVVAIVKFSEGDASFTRMFAEDEIAIAAFCEAFDETINECIESGIEYDVEYNEGRCEIGYKTNICK